MPRRGWPLEGLGHRLAVRPRRPHPRLHAGARVSLPRAAMPHQDLQPGTCADRRAPAGRDRRGVGRTRAHVRGDDALPGGPPRGRCRGTRPPPPVGGGASHSAPRRRPGRPPHGCRRPGARPTLAGCGPAWSRPATPRRAGHRSPACSGSGSPTAGSGPRPPVVTAIRAALPRPRFRQHRVHPLEASRPGILVAPCPVVERCAGAPLRAVQAAALSPHPDEPHLREEGRRDGGTRAAGGAPIVCPGR